MNELSDFWLEKRGAVWIARVSGEIDQSNAAELFEAVAGGVPGTAAGLVVDLSEVGYLDSAGIHELFRLQDRFGSRSQHVAIAAPPGAPIRRVLVITALDTVVAVCDGVDVAVGKVGAHG